MTTPISIDSLPTEILGLIVDQVIYTEIAAIDFEHHQSSPAILNVSRKWENLVYSRPAYWSFIVFRLPLFTEVYVNGDMEHGIASSITIQLLQRFRLASDSPKDLRAEIPGKPCDSSRSVCKEIVQEISSSSESFPDLRTYAEHGIRGLFLQILPNLQPHHYQQLVELRISDVYELQYYQDMVSSDKIIFPQLTFLYLVMVDPRIFLDNSICPKLVTLIIVQMGDTLNTRTASMDQLVISMQQFPTIANLVVSQHYLRTERDREYHSKLHHYGVTNLIIRGLSFTSLGWPEDDEIVDGMRFTLNDMIHFFPNLDHLSTRYFSNRHATLLLPASPPTTTKITQLTLLPERIYLPERTDATSSSRIPDEVIYSATRLFTSGAFGNITTLTFGMDLSEYEDYREREHFNWLEQRGTSMSRFHSEMGQLRAFIRALTPVYVLPIIASNSGAGKPQLEWCCPALRVIRFIRVDLSYSSLSRIEDCLESRALLVNQNKGLIPTCLISMKSCNVTSYSSLSAVSRDSQRKLVTFPELDHANVLEFSQIFRDMIGQMDLDMSELFEDDHKEEP